MFGLPPPRHISTLPTAAVVRVGDSVSLAPVSRPPATSNQSSLHAKTGGLDFGRRTAQFDPKRSLGPSRGFGRCCTTPAIAPNWLGASGGKRAAIHSEGGGYSMTSSARARIDGGTVNPSAFAVFRLTTNSNIAMAERYGLSMTSSRSSATVPVLARILRTKINHQSQSRSE
jgi:hypothetical protein